MRTVVAEPSQLGECPNWDDRHRRLWWIDVTRKAMSSCDPDGGGIQRRTLRDHPGSFAFRSSRGMVVAFRRSVALFDDRGIELATTPLPEDIVGRQRFNDGACDSRGRFWVGTMDPRLREATGGLYRIDPDLSMHRMTDGIQLSNGIAFSPDDTTLYQCETASRRILVHDFDAGTGTVTNRRAFVQFDDGARGRPDGCKVDAAGNLWVAVPRSGRILRFDQGGDLIGEVRTPTAFPSSLAFGGDDMRTLYVTSMLPHDGEGCPADGRIFATEVETPGLRANRFAG